MWVFVLMVSLLDQNQAAPSAGERGGSAQVSLQQVEQTTVELELPGITQQTTSSSSSSSSSSESSQSSEEVESQLRDQENLSLMNSSLWLNELVSLGEGVDERPTGDSVEEQDLMTTQTTGSITTTAGGGAKRDNNAEFGRLLGNSVERDHDHGPHSCHGDEPALELGL